MAKVESFIDIATPREVVFDLVRDQAWRPRFLPDGWHFIGQLADQTEGAGSRMEIEWRLGPGRTQQVIETLSVSENQVVEGPPTADNFVTTWDVVEDAQGTVVRLAMEFSYGGFIGEFLVRRQLRRAMRQMLQRLKQLAEESE